MLLRNLNTPNLCNGTRLCIKSLMPNLIEATILTGKATGEDVFIPRIPLIPTDMPFNFKRLQFPLRLAFAITINKSQGQSIKCTGINLESPCFSHGQLLHRHTLFEQIPGMYLADTWNAPLLTSDKPRCICLPSLGSCLADGRLIC
ncbi:hypothetical protein FKM82_007336 [Ascaphus truei]